MKLPCNRNLAVVLMTVGLCSSACALPCLQLDVAGSHHYDSATQTIIADSNPFSVRALINATIKDLNRTYYLSAAITPKAALGDDFGSFKLNGVTYRSGNMNYGTPPVDETMKDIPGHSIFPTYFTELAFRIVPGQTLPAYNTQDDKPAKGSLYYVDFLTSVAGLLPANSVHFDLYTYDAVGKKVDAFAPFSHDAQSGTHGFVLLNSPLPDGGATLLLLGLSLCGLGYLRRKIA
jgi:hypothetical protein